MRVFLDTNLLVYSFDSSEPDKQRRAQALLRESQHTYVVSTQVLLELYAVLSRRLDPPLAPAEAHRVVERLAELPVVPSDARLVLRAVRTAERHQLSIWDAMIIEAAAEDGCAELWTEDLAAGATLSEVRIVNPFQG